VGEQLGDADGVPGHEPEGRLEPDHAAECRRQPDRPTLVGSHRQRPQPGGDGGGAAPVEPPGVWASDQGFRLTPSWSPTTVVTRMSAFFSACR
jgi:hypothetical protein